MTRSGKTRTIVLMSLSALAFCAMTGCSKFWQQDQRTATTTAFVAAYNARDAAAMMEMVTEDVRWLSVDGDAIQAEASGRDELEAAMTIFFKGSSRASSRMRIIRQDGNFVFGVEEIMRQPSDENKNKCSVVVYEFTRVLIKNVWYFPAYVC